MKRLILLLTIVVTACTPAKDPEVTSLSETVKELRAQVAQMDQMRANNAKLEQRVSMLEVQQKWAQDTTSMLDVTDKGYSIAKTNLGELLFAVQDMTPYGNGVKLKLLVGNPGMATYNGAKLNFKWGKSLDISQPDFSYGDWEKSLHSKELTVPNTLYPGTWNPVEVILAPAKPDETAYLSVAASLNNVQLRPPVLQ
ncbi:DUF3251 domain-containing protein [Paraburkholderia sp. C35]|uniref:DUF3251 domain-containing protein n=1 Tax=Paraburkholderia sp. C35 TaxID=2126993 RepID=UPI000D68E35C|nr:DUF3251 domain-containing protein [Paraburkholderia sp. C35]